MEAQDCVLKTRVALIGKTAPLLKGRVAGEVGKHPSMGETVIVEWDDGRVQKVTLRSLITEEAALLEDARLQAEKNELEAQFEKAEGEIRGKLQKAATLIGEASKLAHVHNMSLPDLDAASELERAMERGGWRTSSWHC